MKFLILSTLALLCCFISFMDPSEASTSLCSQFNGHFDDAQGNRQFLKSSADCKSLNWQSGTDTKLIMTDDTERKVETSLARYDLYVRAHFENDHDLVITYRLQDDAGTVISQTKSEYQITTTDRVRLTETNYAVAADGTQTQESQNVLLMVH